MPSLIPPTVMDVGDTLSSDILALTGELELLFQASSENRSFTSLVRVVVDGLRPGEEEFRPVGTFLLTDTESVSYTLSEPPPEARIRAECLAGKALFEAQELPREVSTTPSPEMGAEPGGVLVIDASGEITSLSPPSPLHYFGTDASGTVGYHPLPVGSGSNRVWNETPTGGIDGVNREFLLAASPVGTSLHLSKNGILRREGTGEDFILTGPLIKYHPDGVPQPGDTHVASYDF